MMISTADRCRSLVGRLGNSVLGIMAPRFAAVPSAFATVAADDGLYEATLTALQRFRGAIYVEEGAIPSSDLDQFGRHRAMIDGMSWHVFLLNHQLEMSGCVRLTVYPSRVRCSDLNLYQLICRMDATMARRYEVAVQAHLERAYDSGRTIGEIGGLAVDKESRNTCKSLLLIGVCWAIGQLGGKYCAVSTMTTRHKATQLLTRLGAYSLAAGGAILPRFYDSYYGCEMELIGFDSDQVAPRFEDTVGELCHLLSSYFVITPRSGAGAATC